MTHDSYRDMIQRELDCDLSASELILLEEHVVTCADCRQEREQFSSLASVFGKIGHVKPDRSFVPQMVPELPKFVDKKRRHTSQWWRGLSVAAVMVLAVGVSTDWQFGIGKNLSSDEQKVASVQDPRGQDSVSVNQDAPQQVVPLQPNEEQVGMTAEQNQTPPKLITQETVKKKPPVKVVAASSGDVSKVESQTGVKVEQSASTAAGATDASKPGEVVVAAVDSTATDVKVHGNNVTVVLVPTERKSGDSEVSVYGIAANNSGPHTITFTDPEGNVISQTEVDLPPSDAIIGKKTQLNKLMNESMQEQARKNEEQAWALDSYQVVKRNLTNLGFVANAEVVSTNHADVVHVVQGGIQYEVLLEQPFEKGAKGIWRPMQISRLIKTAQPQPFEKPIITYFDSLRTSGKVTDFEIYLMGPLTNGRVTLDVSLSKQDSNGQVSVEEAVYEFTLKQLPDGAWQSVGGPTVRK